MLSTAAVVLSALTTALLTVLAAPALASPDGAQESATGGFAITFVVLLVGATAFALIWRAVSKKRER